MQAHHSPIVFNKLILALGTTSASLLVAAASWGQTPPAVVAEPQAAAPVAIAPEPPPPPSEPVASVVDEASETEESAAQVEAENAVAEAMPTADSVMQEPEQTFAQTVQLESAIAPASTEQAAIPEQQPEDEALSTRADDLLPADDSERLFVEHTPFQIAQAEDIDVGSGFSFGFGSGVRPPTALQGATRSRTVIPGNNQRRGISLGAYARLNFSDTQYLLLDAVGGESIAALDLSYTYLLDASPRRGFSVNIFNQRSFYPAFTGGDPDVDLPNGDTPWVHRLGGGIEYFQPIVTNLSAAVGVNYQRVSVRDGLFGDEVYPFDEEGNALTFGDTGQDDLLTLNLAALYSTVDEPLYPSRGTRIRFGIDQSIPVGDAEIGFTRLAGNLTGFLPLNLFGFSEGPRVLVLNLQGGTIIGDVPPYESFNLGGVNSVRGFGKGGVGSGSSFIQATVEYRFPIASFGIGSEDIDLAGALFVDYGTDLGTADEVTGNPAEARDRPGDGFGVGVGLRAVTAFGLARLEFAVTDDDSSELHFTIGDRF